MLDYASLAALAAIVREGSFEGAARQLGVTRSAISQRVRALEDRLGTVLVVRGAPCRATDAGQLLCAHVERVRLLEGEMAATLPALATQGLAAGPPTVRIAVNADSLATWFMPALAAFTRQTGAMVDLLVDDEDHTAGRLGSGEVLAAVTTAALALQGCRTTRLGDLRYGAVAAPDFARHWFPGGVTAEALAAAPVLRFDRRDQLQVAWAREVAGVALTAPMHVIPSTHGFVDAALAGLGWCMTPLAMSAPHLGTGRLVDLAVGRYLDVPLYWQSARIGHSLLASLTREVMAAASSRL